MKTSGVDMETIELTLLAAIPAPPYTLTDNGGHISVTASEPGQLTLIRRSGRKTKVTIPPLPKPLAITGPWTITFPPNTGAPGVIKLDHLVSFSEHTDPGVKHFSGTATCRATFDAPKGLIGKNRRLQLDLGNVQVMAQVKLNGKDLGILWKPPYSADVTSLIKPGKNHIEVKVTNLWVNRMIGDEHLPEDSDRRIDGMINSWPQWLQEGKPSPTGRYTFTTTRMWKKDEPLPKSGLVGPVTIQVGYRAEVE